MLADVLTRVGSIVSELTGIFRRTPTDNVQVTVTIAVNGFVLTLYKSDCNCPEPGKK